MIRGQCLTGTSPWVQLSVKERGEEARQPVCPSMPSRVLLGCVITEPDLPGALREHSVLLGSAHLSTRLTLQTITDISESVVPSETVDPDSVCQLQLTLGISTYKSKSLGAFPQLVMTPQAGSSDILSENKVGTTSRPGLIYRIALYKYHLVINKSSLNKMLIMGKLGHLIYL